MINKRSKKRPFILFSMLLSFILILFLPLEASAGVTWTPDNISTGSTIMSPGDNVIYPAEDEEDANYVSITYYSAEGNYLDYDSDLHGVIVNGYLDPSTGITYSKYRVTGCNVDWDSLDITLVGIKPVVQKKLTGISITNPPAKTVYTEGENFDRSGMSVVAAYSDNSSAQINSYSVNPGNGLKAGTAYTTVSYTEGGITKTATQAISVKAKPVNSYTIQAGAGAGGNISPSGNQSVNSGDSKTFNITPVSGYQIDKVVVDGANQGAISSYTFNNVTAGHTITAYFKTSVVQTFPLNVIGSFASPSGTGNYAPGTVITIQAGSVPGYVFTGWTTSDGRTFSSASVTITMPRYALNINASWAPAGNIAPVQQVTTTNLQGKQLTSWDSIAVKLDTLTTKNLVKTSPCILRVSTLQNICYIPQNVIAHLNARKGVELQVKAGNDVSFSFYSDLDNSAFTGTNLSYASASGNVNGVKQMAVDFVEKGLVGTNIAMHVKLPGALPGQTAYVYIVNAAGQQTLYAPVIVSSDGSASFAISSKVKFIITY